MLNMNAKIDFSLFESLREGGADKLIGGFSTTFSLSSLEQTNEIEESNNCLGGNCKNGCGIGQNISCNTVANCTN